MALVGNHLPKEIMWEWLKSKKTDWTEFFNFLEDFARTAKEMLTNESINAATNHILANVTKLRMLQLSKEETKPVLSATSQPINTKQRLEQKES